eukprot:CAMPEP_0197540902 /NCGR_PEP_ID=MMETSP1318-20131121/66861_1 /TAXON_ID=552666 /ORGANISM="Partenskyella glossopodia, Strain RCC365" /LENGTH=272 /DNA_ID=CAMNT_0043100015 /DNA_START=482 /DNA_END=1300 /DNA_ORIENTATION=-
MPEDTKQVEKNIARVQELLAEIARGNPKGYVDGISEDFVGTIMSGIVPGGESIKGKEGMMAFFENSSKVVEVLKFEAVDWCGKGDNVYFTVNWEFIYKPTQQFVKTTGNVRKVLKNNLICEKYHLINADAIKKTKADPRPESNIKLVQDAVGEYMKGNPAGYVAACHEDFSGCILPGLVPSGEKIKGLDGLNKMLNDIPTYLDIKKFEPVNWSGVNNIVYFTVNWEFVYKPTGAFVKTSSVVRKVIKDGKICEKYHIADAETVKKAKSLVSA